MAGDILGIEEFARERSIVVGGVSQETMPIGLGDGHTMRATSMNGFFVLGRPDSISDAVRFVREVWKEAGLSGKEPDVQLTFNDEFGKPMRFDWTATVTEVIIR